MGGGGAQDRSPGSPAHSTLPAPRAVTAVAGQGQVTVGWEPVPGAIGYAVHRSPSPDGPFTVVDHGGGDVLAVPHGPYADTTSGRGGWYAVAALQTVNALGPLSPPVSASSPTPDDATQHQPTPSVGTYAAPTGRTPHTTFTTFTTDTAVSPLPTADGASVSPLHAPDGTAVQPLPTTDTTADSPLHASDVVTVTVGSSQSPLHRVWEAMIGSEHLSHLLSEDSTGGRPIGAELRAALARVRDQLGVRAVRAHGILGDGLGVYREVDGRPVYDFSDVDRVYDIVRDIGMVPVVEFGFMPRDLARDPSRTVFTYGGIISPPKDWDRWAWLITAFTAHIVDRYGLAEVRDRWSFEVWNEPNLSVFWSGTHAEYWRLYSVTAAAVKSVHPALRVGGPATAAVGWVEDAADADFVSTHVYGTLPLDLRPLTGGRPIAWTEWGVTATHGSPINDTVFAAAFLLRGMHSAAGRMQALLAPWVASDHFEELGRPPSLFHGGFGLLTVGNLAKPKFWALWLAAKLGPVQLPVTLVGDGADSLVQAWASRYDDAGLGILLWNSTLDHSKMRGSPLLSRTVHLKLDLPTAHTVRVGRVDNTHGDVADTWQGEWPSAAQWQTLSAADHLPEAEPKRGLAPGRELTVTSPTRA
jgi:xylan 1,4-beta-xylosidase